jgi:hypothetical protein
MQSGGGYYTPFKIFRRFEGRFCWVPPLTHLFALM